MSRAARRQAQARAISAHPVDYAQPHNPECPQAAKVAQLVGDRDDGWTIDPRPCVYCGTSTTVFHDLASVWVCLLCGTHGPLSGDERVLH